MLQFTLNTTNAVAAQELPRSQDAVGFKQSIPIQHLNEIDTTGDDEADHDVKEMTRELLDLVKSEDELLTENMQVISNLQLHPGNINVNIKYNFVTQDETLQHKNETAAAGELRTALERIESLKSDDASEDPLLRLIDNIVQTQELPRKDDIVHNKQLQINSTPVTPGKKTAEEIAPGASSRLPIIAVDKDLYDATATTTTERTQKDEDNVVALRKNLSPADFLRMCFLHGEGCEFGLGKGSSPEPSTTPAPLITTTTPATTTTELPSNQMKLIQNRLRLCFFSNICDGSDNNIESDKVNSDKGQERRESLRQPRIIKTSEEVQHNNIKPLTSSERRRQTIKKLIQERARACLFHGVCN